MVNKFAIDKTIAVDGFSYHYRDWGGRGWPVVLLHDVASTGHEWDLVAPLLVEDMRVIAPDLRGHGQTLKPDEGYSFIDTGRDTLALLDAITFDRPVVVGHGWGAQIGLWLAANEGDAISGLVMIDGGFIDYSAMAWKEVQSLISVNNSDAMHVEEFRERIIEDAPQGLITSAVEAAIMSRVEIQEDDTVSLRLPGSAQKEILKMIWQQPVTELLDVVECPVLVVSACKDDPLHVKGVEQAQQVIEYLDVIWLDDCTDDVPLQFPRAIADAVQEFVTEQV